ncbi:type II toxin-antitoxin system HicB family antitoxin [bacterium]|nr:type II toxin-antitoxin system HicB family antitoxin [bacterium]
MRQYLYPIIVECLEEGGYYAECPILQGCHVEGTTYAEVMENIEDAIKLMLKSYQELNKELPQVPILKGDVIVTSSIPVAVGSK